MNCCEMHTVTFYGWMLKFELTHKMYSYTTTLSLLNMDCVFPGAGFMYILGLVMSLTQEECCVVSTSRLLQSFSLKANIFLCFEL